MVNAELLFNGPRHDEDDSVSDCDKNSFNRYALSDIKIHTQASWLLTEILKDKILRQELRS